MTTEQKGNEQMDILAFHPQRSYDIGVLRPGMTEDMTNAQLVTAGRHRAQTLLGSQLIEHGVPTVDLLFKINPFKLPAKVSLTIFEVDPVTKERRFFGKGSVLPPSIPTVPSAADGLSDEDDAPARPERVIPLFDPEPRRDDPIVRAERQTISVLRDELATRDQAVERSHRITEQALLQNDRMLDQIRETLDTIKEIGRDRDESAKKLASMEAQVESIIKLREFEESIRKEREQEREQWREKERQLQKEAEAKGQQGQGLGDLMETLTPFAPIIEMLLQRLLPPQNPYGGMPPGGMPPGGMPPGMMPGMGPGGMPPGMPPGMMPPGAMPPGMMQHGVPGMPPQQTSGVRPQQSNGAPPARPAAPPQKPPAQNGVASDMNGVNIF